jgi:hypothetical protein
MTKRHETAENRTYLSDIEAPAADHSFQVEISSMTIASPKREIAFIDRGVDDLATLLAGIRPDVEPILLSNDEPAPRQMARAVQGREGQLDAIHVIAHGRPGEVSFTSGALTVEGVGLYASDFAEIGRSLPCGALQLWSCRTAQGKRGVHFVDALAYVSGVEVAASEGVIGAARAGGTWNLFNSQLQPSGNVPLIQGAIEGYTGILAININLINSGGTGTTAYTEQSTVLLFSSTTFSGSTGDANKTDGRQR